MINKKRIADRFLSLAAIDSPSFGERRMADRLTWELKKLGLTVEEDGAAAEIHGNAGNLFARLDGGSGEPVLLAGHMDTVDPSRGKKPLLHADGTITSDGTTVLGADDLGGVTAILESLTSVLEDGLPRRPLEILFSAAEEPYDRGSEAFDFRRIRSREAYVFDLDGEVGGAACAAPSICSFAVEVRGKSSHAGFAPEEGIHAISAAASAIRDLKMGRVDSETTLNVGIIRGGSAANIVPDLCTVKGELRSYSNEKAEKLLDTVVDTFSKAAASIGAACRTESRFGCRAYQISPGEPVAREYREACKKAGVEADFFRTFGGSDANQLNSHGIRSLAAASAMHRVHTCREYTKVGEIAKVAEIIQALLLCR